ncbi:hypothetical protein [Streptomyces cavernae]|uniref:hypothetical protein n=1 Tax=Streptomyces cavernae TaxID=2259034 RepID=UPI001EE3A65B|nr:hypothetical protein [Streptomyces cavernae]
MNAQPSHVQVVVSDCSATDAGRLFAVLRRLFASDRDDGDVPPTGSTAWLGTFDTDAVRPPAPDVRVSLTGPVLADLQGTPLAVRRLEHVLEDTFTVHELGSASGDQEVEIVLRLEQRR